ncbi:MAG TPA: ABC transporter ATP-binding protein/permease [Microvirga sp.]|jgi:putative ATP-binding cassette transporter|nr:ABC transporter ATP-binding protein/permease [Microvirga sp.]
MFKAPLATILAVAAAALAAIITLSMLGSGPRLPFHVPLAGFAMAALLVLSARVSSFVRIFIVMYALGYLVLAGGVFLATQGLLGETLAEMLPPAFSATAAVVFAGVVYGVSFLPVIRQITAIADPFFNSNEPTERGGPFSWAGRTEGRVGALLVGLAVFVTFAQVALQIRLNLWSRDLFNALEAKQADAFWYQLLAVFVPLAAVWISIAIYDVYIDRVLRIRWRAWLTRHTYTRWLSNGTHYRIPLTGEPADNPDQRIQADVAAFIVTTMSLSITLLSRAATLVSFIVILWGLSRDFVIPGTDGLVIPGFLVWLVIAYAVLGTILTHLIGRPLIRLDFQQEKVEADFRFSLARLREYNEQIALMRGERAEVERLGGSFGTVVQNFHRITSRMMKLTTFNGAYNQTSVVFPYILAAPSYFLGKITLGQFQQTAGAFNQVDASLSYFVNAYTTLAAYKATVDRLTTFNEAMARAEGLADTAKAGVLSQHAGRDLVVDDLVVGLPEGRKLVQMTDLTFKAGETTLLTGPSGSGKSTFFRALSGIWPFGTGRVRIPQGASMLLLPQRPYIPQGTLRQAVTYPGTENAYPDAAIVEALKAARLPQIADRLDEERAWGHTLSLGEQQRLAIARALLAKPDWLFLDEATAALDEPTEKAVYDVLKDKLPNTTVVSIGHRSTLAAFHERRIDMRQAEDGLFKPADARQAVPAE